MRLAQISHFLLHPTASKTWVLKEYFQTVLASLIGVIFGLLMGMTALVALLGSWGASHAGEPGMLLIKVLIVLTFVIVSVFIFTRVSDGGEEEEEDFN